jgi:hypothetical protein
MVSISKFAKEHLPLCICTLGTAIIGYLGYRAVRWIINKCQRTEKINDVAKNIPRPQPTPKPLLKRVSNLEISPGKITMGQGEYVVFHKLPNGETKQVSPETFEQVYQILLQHSPAALVEGANRSELIKAKLKDLDPTLEAIFVPRTLLELIFIRKCIREDDKLSWLPDEASSEATEPQAVKQESVATSGESTARPFRTCPYIPLAISIPL